MLFSRRILPQKGQPAQAVKDIILELIEQQTFDFGMDDSAGER